MFKLKNQIAKTPTGKVLIFFNQFWYSKILKTNRKKFMIENKLIRLNAVF